MSISVCIASYNGQNYIEKQIFSILDQLKVNDEIIIVDDCSLDKTINVISKINDKRIRVLKNNTVNASVIEDAIRLVNPSFNQNKHTYLSNKFNKNELSSLKESKKNKGTVILQVLKKTSKGVNTQTNDLYQSLLSLINIGQVQLAKSILVEYLIYHSRIRA